MSYNKITALTANVRAIELAMRLHTNGASATQEDREILSAYTGFGGIKEIMGIGTANPMPDGLSEQTEKLLQLIDGYSGFSDDTMRKDALDCIKASVLTAFYTPAFIIDAIAKEIHSLFRKHSLTMRSFLEPSAGTGGFLPVAMDDTATYAIEKDPITGLVLSMLHDDTNVTIDGYETISGQDLPHKSFNVIASNIPFGNFSVFDAELWKRGGIYDKATKTIHNYFFVKSMELLNEGGLLVFITSRGVADTPGNKFVREYLVSHADLITALRLPDNLFMETGGIEVGSDLLIFQKHTGKVLQSHREKLFIQSLKETFNNGETTEPINRLFTMPNTALATGSSIGMNQYGKYVRKYRWSNGTESMGQYLSAILKSDFDRYFRKSLFLEGKTSEPFAVTLFGDAEDIQTDKGRRAYTGQMTEWLKEGALVIMEGQTGTLKVRKSKHYNDVAVDFDPMPEDGVNTERAKDYLPLRETYFELSTKEMEEMSEQADLRKRLNSLYDTFVSKWGYFHNNDNREFFMLDGLGVEVFTIETQNGTEISKSDIMREPVAFKKIETDTVMTPTEALASSLNFYGGVNMPYILKSTQQIIDDVIAALKGEIFFNPMIYDWEAKGKFIAGNVIVKQKDILACMEEMPDDVREYAELSLKALEDATPEAIPYEELDINMGERWIDPQLYAMFATKLFGMETQVMYFDVNDTYVVSLRGYSPVAYNTYSVRNYNGEELFVHALHDTVPEITKEIYCDGEKKRVPDEEAIQEAGAKIQEIRNLFNEWLDRQPLFVRDEIVTTYNERFNCYVRPSYDGSCQTFPGLSFNQLGYDALYSSQKDAIQMIKQLLLETTMQESAHESAHFILPAIEKVECDFEYVPEYMIIGSYDKYYYDLKNTYERNKQEVLELLNQLREINIGSSLIYSKDLPLNKKSEKISFLIYKLKMMFEKRSENCHKSIIYEPKILSTLETNIDAKYFNHALYNLLDNAIKYGHEGSFIRINLDVDKRKENMIITITSYGIKIENDDRIYRLFERSADASYIAGGTGIGMYIVKKICKAHNGDITHKSELLCNYNIPVLINYKKNRNLISSIPNREAEIDKALSSLSDEIGKEVVSNSTFVKYSRVFTSRIDTPTFRNIFYMTIPLY